MARDPDAVVIGSGPNGLAAPIPPAQGGASVLVLEGNHEIGGGARTAELTLPGFHHDVCSGCHPMGILSPFFESLPLAQHGLTWIKPPASVAHPLDDGPAVMLWRSVEETARGLGIDGERYRRLVAPFVREARAFVRDVLAPVGAPPRHPLLLVRFGTSILRSAVAFARRFDGAR